MPHTASAGIGPGIMLIQSSGLCKDYKNLYPNTQIPNNGDAVYTNITEVFPNYFYAGYRDFGDYHCDVNKCTLVLYNKMETLILPGGEKCWQAKANFILGETKNVEYTDGFTCYSSAACKKATALAPKPAEKLPMDGELEDDSTLEEDSFIDSEVEPQITVETLINSTPQLIEDPEAYSEPEFYTIPEVSNGVLPPYEALQLEPPQSNATPPLAPLPAPVAWPAF